MLEANILSFIKTQETNTKVSLLLFYLAFWNQTFRK